MLKHTLEGAGNGGKYNLKGVYKMIVNAHYRGKVGAAAPKFTYTGNYNIRKDGVVELLTSGTIMFLEPKVIDVFMVGGGAGGSEPPEGGASGYSAYPGGAGGYTRTIRRLSVAANTSIPVTVGAGGTVTNGYPWTASAGGSSGFNNLTVSGAVVRSSIGNIPSAKTNGGSGGGGGVTSNSDYGSGGSDGADGEAGYSSYDGSRPVGGSGQGFTTREFGEAEGKLYAGGGGGGRGISSQQPVTSMGGSGGGGTGGWFASSTLFQAAAAGVANTGGGGGGGARGANVIELGYARGASGGSGIVCFREAAGLPELAGTWVLNERLYYPDSALDESFNFTAVSVSASNQQCNRWLLRLFDGTPEMRFYFTTGGSNQIYNFKTNTWNNSYKYKTIIIPSGTAVSNEFRAWLASNATKQ